MRNLPSPNACSRAAPAAPVTATRPPLLPPTLRSPLCTEPPGPRALLGHVPRLLSPPSSCSTCQQWGPGAVGQLAWSLQSPRGSQTHCSQPAPGGTTVCICPATPALPACPAHQRRRVRPITVLQLPQPQPQCPGSAAGFPVSLHPHAARRGLGTALPRHQPPPCRAPPGLSRGQPAGSGAGRDCTIGPGPTSPLGGAAGAHSWSRNTGLAPTPSMSPEPLLLCMGARTTGLHSPMGWCWLLGQGRGMGSSSSCIWGLSQSRAAASSAQLA